MGSVENQAERVMDILRQRGERITLQRKLIIEALTRGKGHQTISEVHQDLQSLGNDIDESTIYRVLQWLKEMHVVSQTDLGTNGIVYELIEDTPHHHLVCLNCGLILHLDDSFTNQLRDDLRHEYGFEPRLDHLALFGWCSECWQQREAR
jgi:Fur family transcriptional regulator, ferric uptake regulator